VCRTVTAPSAFGAAMGPGDGGTAHRRVTVFGGPTAVSAETEAAVATRVNGNVVS
jgi:hypothetical protein